MIAHCPKCGKFAHEYYVCPTLMVRGDCFSPQFYRITLYYLCCERCKHYFIKKTEERLR